MAINLSARPLTAKEEKKSKLTMPIPTCVFELKEIEGVDSLIFTVSAPVPSQEVIEAFQTSRFGKTTYEMVETTDAAGKKTKEYKLDDKGEKIVKEDNSKVVSSIKTLLLSVVGEPFKFPLFNEDGTPALDEDGMPQFAILRDEESGTEFSLDAEISGRVGDKSTDE